MTSSAHLDAPLSCSGSMLDPLEVGPRPDHWKRFAVLVAHDLKEPLRNTANCARMLSSLIKDESEEVQEVTRWLLDSADRLYEMVDALLVHARLGHESCESLNLKSMVEDVTSDLRCLIRKTDGKVHVEDLSAVYAGPLGMRLILINLIENALKYARPGVPPHIHVEARKAEGSCEVLIRDNGKGMTTAQVEQAFEPFRRFDDASDGLGMGLSHVYKIVEAHRGSIDIQSKEGEGTTFILRFPN